MEYEYFYSPQVTPLQENHEVQIEVTEQATKSRITVRAVVGSTPEALPGAEKLWLFSEKGRQEAPWYIKVLERIEEEEEPDVGPMARQRLTLGQRKGRMLADMIREREEKKRGDPDEERV